MGARFSPPALLFINHSCRCINLLPAAWICFTSRTLLIDEQPTGALEGLPSRHTCLLDADVFSNPVQDDIYNRLVKLSVLKNQMLGTAYHHQVFVFGR